jgi:hypothetical protein
MRGVVGRAFRDDADAVLRRRDKQFLIDIGGFISSGDAMNLPPLYKYLDTEGARLTLENRCFKHAKPSTFNDTEDLTIRSIFPEDHETALKILKEGFVDTLVKHLNDKPTCLNVGMRTKVSLVLKTLKAKPELAETMKQHIEAAPLGQIFTLEGLKNRNANYIAEINLFMQGFRILCVSTLNTSEKMWERYADNHGGVVLRILPNVAKDSKYQRFQPVAYREQRPPLYTSAAAFQEESLFGDQNARIKEAMDAIIYSKTLEWEYESEYRLAIPLGHGERDWTTMPYHPEELSEIHIGANAQPVFREQIILLAKSVHPQIQIFQISRDANGELVSVKTVDQQGP